MNAKAHRLPHEKVKQTNIGHTIDQILQSLSIQSLSIMNSAAFTVGDGDYSLAALEKVWSQPAQISLSESRRKSVNMSAGIVESAAAGERAVYGINTGFGKLAQTRIDIADTRTLQRNLILSHCAGTGPVVDRDIVRLMMLLKIMSLVQGASGVRWTSIELLCDMLSRDVIPIIPAQGSVGASGDLAQLAHMTAVMLGHGDAEFNGRRLAAKDALRSAELAPIVLEAKEGLAFINGTQYCTAQALSALFKVRKLLLTSMVSGALSTDALMGSSAPFRPRLHELRRQHGQIAVAQMLRALLTGSEIRESHRDDDKRVQDPYSFRCQPQVMGACLDLLVTAGRTLEREANAVTDNPLVIIPDSSDIEGNLSDSGAGERDAAAFNPAEIDPAQFIVSGGNFHAEPVAFAADQIALAVAETGAIAQRRIATLVDPALNYGLPAFLSPEPGINSGFMIAEVTAAALMSENKHCASPASVDSTPTSANQEDHVSMAAHAARRLHGMATNLTRILAIELLCAAQGVEMRKPLATSPNLTEAINLLRTQVKALTQDRELHSDIGSTAELIDRAGFADIVVRLGFDDLVFST